MRERLQQVMTSKLPRRHKPDYQIALFMTLLMLLGLVVMYAIGPQRAHVLNMSFGTDNYSDTYFFVKQITSLLFAVIAFVVVAKVPFKFFTTHAGRLIAIAIGASVVLAFAAALGLGIAQCSLGACRWFDLGPLGSIQPAEFLKFALLVFLAGFLGSRFSQGKINDRDATLIPVGLLLLVSIILVIGVQRDMGTGLALIAIAATMLFAAGVRMKIALIALAAIVALGVLFILIAPHRMQRVTTFFAGDSASVNDAETYHIAHAKIAIGSGGLLGVGIGNSVQATGYLPEAINDSVFAIMGETFGFVGLVVILSLFFALLMRILRVADHLSDIRLRLIAVGVFGWLASHIILNIAAMTGLVPLTGITLPLLSFGGTSMVFIAGALGLVFQLSRYTVNDTSVEGESNESTRNRRGLGRTHNAYRSRA